MPELPSPSMRLFFLLLLGLLVTTGADAAVPEPAAPLVLPTDEELAARLGFLEQRLEAQRPTALAWQYGWTGFYIAGLATNVAYAVRADDGDQRVRGIVDAAKSGLATVDMIRLLRDPLPGAAGAAPMRAVAGEGRQARLERLAVGERQLRASAERAETRYSWSRHLTGVATNLLGGAAILALGSAKDAAESTLIGIAVGEVQIWSQPWRPAGDLRDYEARFPAERAGWRLRGKGTGVELVLNF
ncbi:MAG: hypothetical protein AB7I59_22875 [Geminicoccaceae bacterium]